MTLINDKYRTIKQVAEGSFRDRKSKFVCNIFNVADETQVKDIIKDLKKNNHSASHHCYAYILGNEKRFRANDDGEPSGSAGMPILGQLKIHDLTNVLAVVARYYGGVKLGVTGLINAYREATLDAINNAIIEEMYWSSEFKISFPWAALNEAMRVIKANNAIQTESIGNNSICTMTVGIRMSLIEKFKEELLKIESLIIIDT